MEAARVAAELTASGVEAEALPGDRSQFDVLVDGVCVYSKRDTHRFPKPGEVARLLGR